MIKTYLENPNENCILKFNINSVNDLNTFNTFVDRIKEHLKVRFEDNSRYKVVVHSKLYKGKLSLLHNNTKVTLGYKRVSYVFIVDCVTNKPYRNLFSLSDLNDIAS